MEKTDQELWLAFEAGQEAAFEELFRRYRDGVFRFSFKMLNNRSHAEDVTSTVFLALFQKKYTPKPGVKLSTWLFTVARNASMDHMRAAKHTVSMWFRNEKGQEEVWDTVDEKAKPGEDVLNKEHAQLLKKALAKLPFEQKEALVLREYMGNNYQDIAAILDCSLEKVKVLIFRAREGLRKEMLPYMKELGNDG